MKKNQNLDQRSDTEIFHDDYEKTHIYFYSLTSVSQILGQISYSMLHASHAINKMILLPFEPCKLVSFSNEHFLTGAAVFRALLI